MDITPQPAVLPDGFYVYEHRRATTGEVFYVGKGRGIRAWQSVNRPSHWRNIARRDGRDVVVLQDGLDEMAAHAIERGLIRIYGRRDLGTGPLVNLTDGGEGTSGRVMSAEQRRQLSESKSAPEAVAANIRVHLGRKRPPQCGARIAAARKGRPLSSDHKEKIAAAMNAPETLAKLRAAQIGKATASQLRASGAVRIECIDAGLVFRSASLAAAWCRSEGRQTSPAAILKAAGHSHRKAGGMRWRRA